MVAKTLHIADEPAMLALGNALAKACLGQGTRVYLSGELGAGKTTLVRGFLAACGYSGRVKSPTYAIVEPYDIADQAIYHFDFYRIEQPRDLQHLGLEEYFAQPAAICLVEWPEHATALLPPPDVAIQLTHQGDARSASFTPVSPWGETIVTRMFHD